MKILYFLFLLCLIPITLLGAPSISGVSGTLTNNSTITIAGSGFSTKSTAAPVIASYNHPTAAYNWGSSGTYDAAWTYNGSQTSLSQTVQRTALPQSSYSSRATMNGDYSNIGITGTAAVNHYLSWWVYQDYDAGNLQDNSKVFRLYLGVSGGDAADMIIRRDPVSGYMRYATDDQSTNTCHNHSYISYSPAPWSFGYYTYDWISTVSSNVPTTKAWHHYEVFLNVPGALTACTSSGYLMVDGVTAMRFADMALTYVGAVPHDMFIVRIGHVSGADNATEYDYIDQVYIDNTPQRVFISTASNLAASWPDIGTAHTSEIQVPSAWADDSITVTLNRGTFAADATAYLYVVDSSGTISSAREITFGDTDETAPTLSNLLPSGNTTYGTTKQLSATTSEYSTCRYHATSTTFSEMSPLSTTGGTSHAQTVNVSVGANSFKVVCQDGSANESSAGTWSFTVAAQAVSGKTIAIGSGSQTISGGGTNTIIFQ